jgi:hypothetical protein
MKLMGITPSNRECGDRSRRRHVRRMKCAGKRKNKSSTNEDEVKIEFVLALEDPEKRRHARRPQAHVSMCWNNVSSSLIGGVYIHSPVCSIVQIYASHLAMQDQTLRTLSPHQNPDCGLVGPLAAA